MQNGKATPPLPALLSNGPLQRVLAYAGMYGGYVVFLHAVDGPWRHWKEGRESKAIDPWLLQHVLWGALGAYMGLSPKQVLILGSVNELVEWGVRTYRPDLLWGTPETPQNVFMDLMASIAGWKLGEMLVSP